MVNGKVVGERLIGAGAPGGFGARGPARRGAGAPATRGAAAPGGGRAARGPGRGPAPAQPITLDISGPCTLDILVHNLGRNSLLTSENGQRRGLVANPTLDGAAVTGWKIYSMPLDNPDQLPASTKTSSATGPTFFSGTFNIADPGETYLDMSNFHFGVVWVNGHNLGRYWDVGTSRAIYLPSPWQKKGENQITVLELGPAPATPEISGVMNMVETPATQIKPLWTISATPEPSRGN
jgi:beta-galactosidase